MTLLETSPPPIAELPDGSKAPKLLQMLGAVVQPIRYLDDLARRYGNFFTARFIGFPPQIVVSDPVAIQQILTADPQLFISGAGNQLLRPLVGVNSMLVLDGDRHQRERKLLMPALHGERMRTYAETIQEITTDVISRWQVEQSVIARPPMQEISLTVILRTVFGLQAGPRYDQMRLIMTDMLNAFNHPLSATFLFLKPLQKDLGAWTPWGKFLQQQRQLDELIYQEISDRRQANAAARARGEEPTGTDILSLLLTARDEDGQPMSDAELRDELITLLMAGHETTAIALSWALYWLHAKPEVEQRLRQELQSLDLTNTEPTNITRLPYLDAFLSEVLRIYPVGLFTFPRILQAPMSLMGYNLPTGTMLSICIYLTHQNPELYPEPRSFRPERFLERQFSPYEYLPFGGGSRRCIGSAFSLFEMKLVLATLLSKCTFSLAEPGPIKPSRRGLVLAPSGGVRLVVKEIHS
jgi:cytochrome P450 family 110